MHKVRQMDAAPAMFVLAGTGRALAATLSPPDLTLLCKRVDYATALQYDAETETMARGIVSLGQLQSIQRPMQRLVCYHGHR